MNGLEGWDLGIMEAVRDLHQPWLDPWLRPAFGAITTLGNPWPMTGVVVAFACLFAWLRRYRYAFIIVCVGSAAGGLHVAVKHFVNRTRPNVVWRDIDLPDQPSFPSGHAMGAMGIYLGGAGGPR